MFLISFREQELQLQPQAPIRTIIGCFHIVESLNLGVHRLVADLEDLTETAAEWHRPLVAAVRLPVGGNNRGRGEIPAVSHVVVDEILEEELVHVCTVIISVAQRSICLCQEHQRSLLEKKKPAPRPR